MFRIQVNKSEIEVLERESLVSGSVGINKVRFSFSKDWDGYVKTAIFISDYVPPIIDDEEEELIGPVSALLDENNECYIPHEVLAYAAPLRVGVCGTKDETQIMPTRIASLGQIQEGICQSHTATVEPTPDVYQQILAKIAELKQLVSGNESK